MTTELTWKQANVLLFQQNMNLAVQALMAKGKQYTQEDIMVILLDAYDLTDIYYAEIIHKRLQPEQIVIAVERYEEQQRDLLGEIVLEEPVLPQSLFRDDLYKSQVKLGNEIWRIYKYDADPFPSVPHAHSRESGYKLHLGNGILYKKKNEVGKIHKKDLLKIRNRIECELNITVLPQLEI